MRASQQAPDKEPCQHPPQQSYGGRTIKDKPQPPQASSQPGSEREEPKEGSRKTAGTRTNQQLEHAATNHEGQPRPPTQPTNARDTAGQKHTHPKVREGQQGDLTCKPSRHHRNWSTLTQGAKPQLPKQASGAGEAQ